MPNPTLSPTPTPAPAAATVVSADGVNFVKPLEGLFLKAYRCPAGVLTNGWGHTGPDVTEGQVITIARAELWLVQDLAHAAAAVRADVKVPLTQHEFDALTSFTFNCGTEALRTSTLLRLLNAGHYDAVPAQLLRWDHCDGHVEPGLLARRHAEAVLWSTGLALTHAGTPPAMPQRVDTPAEPPAAA